MAKRRSRPHDRASAALDTPTKALEYVERMGSRWWWGWKNHVADTVDISKSMLEPGYSATQFVQDSVATWFNLPRALLGLGPDPNAVLELDIDSTSEASDVDTVRLSEAAAAAPTASDLVHEKNPKTLGKEFVKVWLSGNSKKTLNACLVGIKAISAGLEPGLYRGTIDLGSGRTFPISVYRSKK